VLPNALEKHCIEAEPFLDKSVRPGKNAAFAHVMLWICRRFSTDAVISRAFLSSQHPQTGVRARFLAMSPKHASSVRPASGFGLST
jgi:hypothetical protein